MIHTCCVEIEGQSIMARFYSFSLLLLTSLSFVSGQDLTASLDYGTFKGTYSSQYNIRFWRKIPFAAPPVGENRFRGPQPPSPITNGTYDSSQSFDVCPQRTVRNSSSQSHLTNEITRSMAQKIVSTWAFTPVPGLTTSLSAL
jgi:hypothetical protein